MLKLSRALRVIALSALMLGAALAEDVAPDENAAGAAAAAAAAAAKAGLGALEDAEPAAGQAGESAGQAQEAPGGAEETSPDADAAARGDSAVDGKVEPAPEQNGDEVKGEGAEDKAMNGLYFFVQREGPMRCFVINQGAGSVFHVHYNFRDAASAEVWLELRHLPLSGSRLKRMNQAPIWTSTIKKEHQRHFQGSVEFELQKGGHHSLCAVTDSAHGLPLYLELDTGKGDSAYKLLQEEFKLDEAQISMVRLKKHAEDLLREADFAKELETSYHKNFLRLNREVLWWPISQVVMLLVMGFFQTRHLKKFFKTKRLV